MRLIFCIGGNVPREPISMTIFSLKRHNATALVCWHLDYRNMIPLNASMYCRPRVRASVIVFTWFRSECPVQTEPGVQKRSKYAGRIATVFFSARHWPAEPVASSRMFAGLPPGRIGAYQIHA